MSWDNQASEKGYLNASLGSASVEYIANDPDRTIVHACLWDDEGPTAETIGASVFDVYDVKVLVTTISLSTPQSARLFVTPVTVTVKNPKTANAEVRSVVRTPGTLTAAGPEYISSPLVTRNFTGTAFEPTISGDGRLIIMRVGSPDMPVGPSGSTTASIDVVYSYYTSGATADPTQWLDVYPVSHAFFDTRINQQFGFAMNQFVDPEGTPIPDWEDFGGTYPWIDRSARNLFFTTVRARLHYGTGGTMARYPISQVPGDPNFAYGGEDGQPTRGPAFAGLWSRGKVVLIDNLNNDMDYAIGTEGPGTTPQQRMVTLFSSGGPLGDGRLQLGYGRANHNPYMPEGENKNTTIIDALENFFNYKDNAVPIARRDVVWFLQNGKHTDQVAFDDHVDPNALIVASMAGLLRLPDDISGTGFNRFEYDDGWDAVSNQFTLPIRVQNAATASHRWLLPPHGILLHSGNGRLEPASIGGINGRGMWLEDGIGLRFDIPDQTLAPSGLNIDEEPAYIGLYVDCRFPNDAIERLLISFPDGSQVFLKGRSQLILTDGTTSLHLATFPTPFTHTDPLLPSPYDFLPQDGWAHLGLQRTDNGQTITLFVNGMPFSKWSHPVASAARLNEGAIIIGDPGGAYSGASFRGWIDDFKVLLHKLDPETVCNHAGGTLLGIQPTASTSSWVRKFADSFDEWVHDELSWELRGRGENTYTEYAVYHNYTVDNGVYDEIFPSDTKSLAKAFHFPEGPVFHDRPRPDSSTNQFCLSCHASQAQGGLGLAALQYSGSMDAKDDPRRQPMQPPAFIRGYVPAGIVNVGGSISEPALAQNLGSGSASLDEWVLPARGVAPSQIEAVLLVAEDDGTPLLELQDGMTVDVDPALLGTNRFSIRARLDSAQGAVNAVLTYPSTGGAGGVTVQKQLANAPYTFYKSPGNPFAGHTFSPGIHDLTFTPSGGTTGYFWFNIFGGVPRMIGQYTTGFSPGSPQRRWIYAWNDTSPITSLGGRKSLNWNPTEQHYTETGADWPNPSELAWGALGPTGGWPGGGNLQAVPDERFVMAGWKVVVDGYVRVQGLDVLPQNPGTTGIEVYCIVDDPQGAAVHVDGQGVATYASPVTGASSATYAVAANSVVWIALGPYGNSAFDRFSLDFEVWFNEMNF